MNELLSVDKLARMSNEELVSAAQQITGRMKNEDWSQFVQDLRISGHIHSHESAPLMLQRFLRLETDLDKELAKRSSNAPLLSSLVLNPRRPTANDRQLLASIASQDNGAYMEVEIDPDSDITNFAFTVKSMLTLRFNLPRLDLDERRTFIERARREFGVAFLWTRERWENDYLVFVRQEYFSRVYAFSRNIEATARLTTQSMGDWMDWLERCWFPRGRGGSRGRRTQQTEALPLPIQPILPTIPTASSTQPKRSSELRKMADEWMAKQKDKDRSSEEDSNLSW